MNLYGRIEVQLAAADSTGTATHTEIINRIIHPPRPVTEEEINVRAIYLVSDQVNAYGGRFPQEELANLCSLLIDSPVMVGHDRSNLPIARNFRAEIVPQNDESWVKVWFYWLKEAEGANALLANLDGGIYKEGSIGFIYSLPECGICGEDIRSCSHTPLKKYEVDGQEKICHYNYRRIEKVLETSLVFRGATPNTRVSNDLVLASEICRTPGKVPSKEAIPINPLIAEEIHFGMGWHGKQERKYYAAPLHFGVPIRGTIKGAQIEFRNEAANREIAIPANLREEIEQARLPELMLYGQLLKLRGKQRFPVYTWQNELQQGNPRGHYLLLAEYFHFPDRDGGSTGNSTSVRTSLKSLRQIKLGGCVHLQSAAMQIPEAAMNAHGSRLLEIAEGGDLRVLELRKPYLFLAEVRDRFMTKAGRQRFRVGLRGSSREEEWNTCDTHIAAEIGDVLLLRAQQLHDGGGFRQIMVADNLGQWREADEAARLIDWPNGGNRYCLRIGAGTALLEIKDGRSELAVFFPHFDQKLMAERKGAIGYEIGQQAKLADLLEPAFKSTRAEIGRAYLKAANKNLQRWRLEGHSLNGDCHIRRVIWQHKRAIIFTWGE